MSPKGYQHRAGALSLSFEHGSIGLARHLQSWLTRGTHNRGVMMGELEKRGCTFRLVATEAPHQLGRVERGGGILKGMMKRVIVGTNATGALEMELVLQECLQTRNRLASISGFSPAQWVLGKNVRTPGWGDEAEENEALVRDDDPGSVFNRRNAMREMSKLAWAYEDSHRRVRAAMLRKGGSPEDEFRPGDMVSFKRKQRTGGWVGPARVIAREDKNYCVATFRYSHPHRIQPHSWGQCRGDVGDGATPEVTATQTTFPGERSCATYLCTHWSKRNLEAIDLTSTSGSRWTTLILPWTLHR